jgi:hypothetical protein
MQALSSPEERGLPSSNWSVPKLAEYCRRKRLLPPVYGRALRKTPPEAKRVRETCSIVPKRSALFYERTSTG